eukprot:5077109-Pyramimonas_sp.AAC.1
MLSLFLSLFLPRCVFWAPRGLGVDCDCLFASIAHYRILSPLLVSSAGRITSGCPSGFSRGCRRIEQ